MVRISRYVPANWESYAPIGEVIPKTRFIIFKTPLNDRLLTKVKKENRFSVSTLLRIIAENRQRLGLVIDLTDTNRYYDQQDIKGMCIEYEKIKCPGRGFVDNEDTVAMFNNAIQRYTEETDDPEALIGVHCTDGVNRSGYLVCRFLIDNLGWSSHEALEAFEKARGYPIANGSYVQELHKAAKRARELADKHTLGQIEDNSASDSDSQKRKKKRVKRKRELEVDEANVIMQQFLGEIQQQAEEIQASVESPMAANSVGYVESPQQKHWAYTTKTKKSKIEEKAKIKQIAKDYEQNVEEIVEDDEVQEEQFDEVFEEEGPSKSQKRRARKQRQQNMLHVMRRGNFHEIREMQEEYMKAKGSQL